MELSNKKAYIKGLETGIPIGLGYFAVAFALGIQAKTAKISVIKSALMSFGLHASAGEYIFITLFGAGTTILVMALMEMVANARYLLMSCSLSQKIPEDTPIWKRLIMGYFITDEIFGAAIAVKGKLNPYYIFGMATVASPGWVVGTALGVALGNVLPESVISALSVGLFGMFIAIIIPEGKKNKVVAVVIIVSFVASYLLSVIPVVKGIDSGVKIIILTVVIAGIFSVLKPVKEVPDEQ
ncbi:MAG: AzlC family ABC transporter permease [Eubacterium sp.]|nr:AzlC family ABC transporter permease [Eubacterium sp.]